MNGTCFCVSVERFTKKRKYDRLLDTSHLETDNVDDDAEGNKKMSGKLTKVGVIIPNLQPKILLLMMNLKRLRDGYEEVMHRFAQHLEHMNNGGTNALLLNKVSGFAP
ncbi:hypothetical protein FNV43_RR21368 [Rhamnella rubrinervis]|uniref:Uncharacterized protein n=1 Tax=Rhamnella rubrinervis TaxID=2594499 RepID=A0A8K0DWI1_9ROSA|nr:hypothetical protein FNV43_RR21368 [Rhamnella rubrinervis]